MASLRLRSSSRAQREVFAVQLDQVERSQHEFSVRLLRKYGDPPDLQDAAVQKVLQQAETLAGDWAA